MDRRMSKRILINALSARLGGGQTYLRHLLDKFPEDDSKIFIICPDDLVIPKNRKNIEKLSLSNKLITNPFLRTFWETFVLPKKLNELKIDILFCPGGSVSGSIPKNCKVVTTFQNMMPFDHVQRKKYSLGYMRFRNWLLERKLLSSMIRSDLVIFISHFAKKVIEEKSHHQIKKSVIIPHGINPHFRKNENLKVKAPDWLPKDGYLLYVSILDVYKSQVEIIEGYAHLRKKMPLPKLVLVGPEYAPYGKLVREAILKNKMSEEIILKSFVKNDDLVGIYQNAMVNIFGSQTENCPFILLEAMASGTPLLVSKSLPMPEFSKDAALYFDANDPLDFAAKCEQLLKDEKLMKEIAKKALEYSYLFNWDNAAQSTWQSIENLV
jgi:glycosyltransferase involved in cell wall biosynthesis